MTALKRGTAIVFVAALFLVPTSSALASTKAATPTPASITSILSSLGGGKISIPNLSGSLGAVKLPALGNLSLNSLASNPLLKPLLSFSVSKTQILALLNGLSASVKAQLTPLVNSLPNGSFTLGSILGK